MKIYCFQNLIFSYKFCHFLVDIGILGWQLKDRGFLVASPMMTLSVSSLEHSYMRI